MLSPPAKAGIGTVLAGAVPISCTGQADQATGADPWLARVAGLSRLSILRMCRRWSLARLGACAGSDPLTATLR
jgi:hypothetical protein